MKYLSLVVFILAILSNGWSQKKVIDYTAFDRWNTLKNEKISHSGKWITYEIQALKGDTYLYWYNVETGKLDSIVRAKNAQFSPDEKKLVFTIEAGYDTLRKVELDKVDKKKWPKDSLGVMMLETRQIQKYANVKEFKVSDKHEWLTFTENDNTLPEKKAEDTGKKKKKKSLAKKKKKVEEKPKKEPKSDGKVVRFVHLNNGKEYVFKNITTYEIAENGHQIAYVHHQNDSSTVKVLNLSNGESTEIPTVYKGIEGITFDKNATKMVFLASQDTTKTKVFELFYHDVVTKNTTCLIDTTSTVIPKQWTVVKGLKPRFADNLNRLYFGVNEIPVPEKKDTLLDSEKPKLDIWTYNEPVLQTQQLASLKRDQNKAYWYAYDFETGAIIEIENDTLKVQSDFYELKDQALVYSTRPYDLEYMWDISGKKDYYSVSLKDGTRKLIKKGVTNAIGLSRKGDQFVYFNHENGNYYAIDLTNSKEICLTCAEKDAIWYQDNNGMPMGYAAIGMHGWNKEGTTVYFSERNDVYQYDFTTNQLTSLTNKKGKKNNIEYSARFWNIDSTYFDITNLYLIGFDKKTKGTHYVHFLDGKMNKAAYWDAKVASMQKSKNASLFTLRKHTVKEYPDLDFWRVDSIAQLHRISNANPQQKEYKWADVELISWKTYKGLELEGLLYKPEDFDPTKSYPLLVYYYELYSDGLHTHYTPRPTASIIFPTEYASADYVVFIPDIRYEPGHPAKSAYDCIMSGTDAVLKKYPNIDEKRMGLQGQSWGGYQTAQLITMTTRFKAAMAGAPVGNMFSAFGGIRWGTGMSRQFQYEKTQSRIGKTIWEAPELYIENSPVFHLPNVQTPLLIMHNDMDGAVPWYQGIEIFTGLRRLGKPSWLLNYNGDDHNLMKMQNRRDLSIRMRQFFDHYLQNKPAPRWMTEGIPALKKGVELRYELDKN